MNLRLQTYNSKLKIAVIGARGFPNVQGGVEKHCEKLYPELVRLGCQVTVFARQPYVGDKRYSWQGIDIISIRCPKTKAFEAIIHSLKAVFAAKKIKPDLVHIQAIGPSLVIPLARLLRLKVVVTNHGPDYERAKWGKFAKFFLKLGEYFGVKFGNAVICISEVIKKQLFSSYGRVSTVIPNGVDISEIPSSNNGTLARFNLEKQRYILNVARFVPEKNLLVLMEAFKNANLDGWKLAIVGDADHEDEHSRDIKQKAKDIENIVLTGLLTGESLKEIYANSGLFVLPSLYEGLPIVLLEAMSFGLNIIASDIPQNREIGLRSERYFNPHSQDEIVEKIKEFVDKGIDEQEKREYMDLLKERYDWRKIAEQTMEVYRLVVSS